MRRFLINLSATALLCIGTVCAVPAFADYEWKSALDERGSPVPAQWANTERFDSVTLASSDTMQVRSGDRWRIRASGDPAVLNELRFLIENGSLVVGRRWREDQLQGKATIEVTAPATNAVTLAGSGRLVAEGLNEDKVTATVAGSGEMVLSDIRTRRFDGTMAGSGRLRASGLGDAASMTIAGSGNLDASALKISNANVTVAGSGDVSVHAEDRVTASIIGSGNIAVTGGAECKLSRMGSGALRCNR